MSIVFLMFFAHFFLLESFFASLELYVENQSGRAILLVIDFFIIICAIAFLIMIEIYEKSTSKKAKIATYFVVFSNCISLFYWQSNYERQIFTRTERFDTSSIAIILIYFIFELLLTYYLISRLYKSEEN